MSAQIKRFIVPDAYRTHPVKMLADGFTATVVLHTDHLASHAYDEEKERALFEADLRSQPHIVNIGRNHLTGKYILDEDENQWLGWLACARSRAKAAGIVENK